MENTETKNRPLLHRRPDNAVTNLYVDYVVFGVITCLYNIISALLDVYA